MSVVEKQGAGAGRRERGGGEEEREERKRAGRKHGKRKGGKCFGGKGMHGRGRGGEGEGERVRARRRGQGALREGRTGRRGIAAMQNAFKFNAKFSKCKVPLWGGKYPDFSNSRPESSVTSVLCPRRSELAGQDPQWCEVLSLS